MRAVAITLVPSCPLDNQRLPRNLSVFKLPKRVLAKQQNYQVSMAQRGNDARHTSSRASVTGRVSSDQELTD